MRARYHDDDASLSHCGRRRGRRERRVRFDERPHAGFVSKYRAEVLADAPLLYWRLGDTVGSSAASEVAADGGVGAGTYLGTVKLGQPGAIAGDPDLAVDFAAEGRVLIDDPRALSGGNGEVAERLLFDARVLQLAALEGRCDGEAGHRELQALCVDMPLFVETRHDVTNVHAANADRGSELVEADGASARLLLREMNNDVSGEGTNIKGAHISTSFVMGVLHIFVRCNPWTARRSNE
jgi:hypothetical protein